MIHNYVMISKISGKNIKKYKGEIILLSDAIPKTVDEVILQSKEDAEKICKILTYRDKNGVVLEKSFEYPDDTLRQRVYTTRYTKINDDENVKSGLIQDYSITRNVLNIAQEIFEKYEELHPSKTYFWDLTQIITNHFSVNKKNGEKIHSQVKMTDLITKNSQRHTFIEFPHIVNNKLQSTLKKVLSFHVNSRNQRVQKNSGVIASGVKFPKRDSYLGLRALPIHETRQIAAQRFLREKNLQGCPITIRGDYYPKDENEELFLAHFEPEDGSVNFNRLQSPKSKSRAIGNARHEIEHCWQYFLRSRVAKPNTQWEADIQNIFGKIKQKKLLSEAKRYAKAIMNYVALSKELKDSKNIKRYEDNYIEVKARKAAKKEERRYNIHGKSIRYSFRHIPEEFL